MIIKKVLNEKDIQDIICEHFDVRPSEVQIKVNGQKIEIEVITSGLKKETGEVLDGKVIEYWEHFKNNTTTDPSFKDTEEVNVKCPICGKKLIRRNNIVLTSYPAQYQYECSCGFIGYAYK